MELWRVSRHQALDGTGGTFAAGRWHTKGQLVTYCSTHSALALVEWIVRLELGIDQVPASIPYIIVDAPNDVSIETIGANRLADDWKSNLIMTQEIGDDWLRSRRTALLRVPSAVVPSGDNILINPLHPDAARLTIVATRDVAFDIRLITRQ